MRKHPQLGELVRCVWVDAFGTATEDYTAEAITNAKPYRMTTYGIFVRDDRGLEGWDAVVGIAAEVSGDGCYRGVTFIPAMCVVSIEHPKAKRSPKKPKGVPSPDMCDAPLL